MVLFMDLAMCWVSNINFKINKEPGTFCAGLFVFIYKFNHSKATGMPSACTMSAFWRGVKSTKSSNYPQWE